ncbi:hypothetical protein ACSBR2_019774 [Camellia fascicularis]
MDLETPIAATEEQLPSADSKRFGEDSSEDSGGAKKLKVEKSAKEDRLDQLEGTEGDKESDRVSVGPKNFGSSVEMFDYFYKFLHYWPPNVNVNVNVNKNEDRSLWKLGTLPPGLITFYSTTKSLDKSWHILGLGYNPSIGMDEINNAAVIHFNGNMKPWLDIALNQFKHLWTKYVDYEMEFVQVCNFGL